ncbi:hypothetical protein K466DRAFT_536182 [Polyporus arcularius HHB13444]|uniref:MARVEL domain-containing protein n=1 Tax=Polyporus arcularius HHB13444 TaxID=1314778 RepID=A0A5C3Q294_9APHY|nr:hypothetical protein K466DRAFT_536182 [Polyporus arcularius HHB13444]
MFWLSLFRIVALGWTCFCAILLLGLGAHVLASVGDLTLPTFAWAGLAVATALLSLVTLPAMLVIDFIRTGAFTSMIVVELAWLGFLGVLFLATGGAAASNATGFWVQCSAWFPAAAVSVCNETSAAAAFGFLGWVAVWAYTGTVLVMLIIQAQRGNYIWQRSVKEINVQGGNNVPPVDMTAPGLYGTDAKPHEQAALHPGQVPYAYPPSTLVSPQPTGQPPIPQV